MSNHIDPRCRVEIPGCDWPSIHNYSKETERQMICDHNRAARHSYISPATPFERAIVKAVWNAMDDKTRNKLHTKEFVVSLANSLDVEDELAALEAAEGRAIQATYGTLGRPD